MTAAPPRPFRFYYIYSILAPRVRVLVTFVGIGRIKYCIDTKTRGDGRRNHLMEGVSIE
jgi:hypothetical protein